MAPHAENVNVLRLGDKRWMLISRAALADASGLSAVAAQSRADILLAIDMPALDGAPVRHALVGADRKLSHF
jgi:hypothetical protein